MTERKSDHLQVLNGGSAQKGENYLRCRTVCLNGRGKQLLRRGGGQEIMKKLTPQYINLTKAKLEIFHNTHKTGKAKHWAVHFWEEVQRTK